MNGLEDAMNDDQKRIIDLFRRNVKGRKPDLSGRNSGHDGRRGHWLEEQFGIRHNADNAADLLGYELKNETSSRTTFGDWSANKYVFNDADYRSVFSGRKAVSRRDRFMRIFGHPSPDGGRYSWSGKPCPKISGFNGFGEVLRIDGSHNRDILAVYDFLHDERPDKGEVVPTEFQQGEVVLARWYGDATPPSASGKCLRAKVEDKFDQSGWFTCKTGPDGAYSEICFGRPMDYDAFLELVRTGEAFFDSGMHEGNPRPYQQWRMNNSGWDRLIVERYQ